MTREEALEILDKKLKKMMTDYQEYLEHSGEPLKAHEEWLHALNMAIEALRSNCEVSAESLVIAGDYIEHDGEKYIKLADVENSIDRWERQERPKGRWISVHEHMWYTFEASIDEFAWESGYHNGPVCELCGERICIHCNPDWEKSECKEESYRCSECNHHVKEKTDFCPNCGSDNRGEEE